MTAAAKTETKTAAKTAADTAGYAVKTAVVNEDAFKSFENLADAAREQFETAMKTFTGASEEWRKQSEALSAEMRERFEKNQKLVAAANAELVEAARTETADAVQFVNDLARARTFADAIEIQRGYWTKLFESRIEQARAITGTAVDVARDSVAPAKTEFGAFFNGKAFEEFFRFPTKI